MQEGASQRMETDGRDVVEFDRDPLNKEEKVDGIC